MDEQTWQEMQQWLIKADHDLQSAARLMTSTDGEPILDTAVYHCQQAAEKAIKAYLTAQKTIFPKLHLLLPLLELCKQTDESFDELFNAAELLTPFATEFRYPGDIMEPELSDAKEAYEMAESVLLFIRSKLETALIQPLTKIKK